MTTPKDIEAAKEIARLMEEEGDIEIVDDENREPVSSHISVNTATKIDEDGISRIAQALAAAREEGRRDMQDECATVFDNRAEAYRIQLIDHHHNPAEERRLTHKMHAARDNASTIRNLPTNAPGGESDE